jgi:hypothetical protein
MSEHVNRAAATTTSWPVSDDDAIAFLQDEIARLEAELTARDEALAHAAAPAADTAESHGLRLRVESLTAELAARDETVNLLLEQTRLFEEAAVAQRAEWDQLRQWVEEVERRVEGRDPGVEALRADLAAERSRAEGLQRSWDAEHRDRGAAYQGLEREVERLRGLVERNTEGRPEGAAEAALLVVEDENRQLREVCDQWRRTAESAGDAKALRSRLDATAAELTQARASLAALDDDRRRERRELEAEIAAIKSRLSRESLAAPEVETPARSAAAEADERIRAFRQHLRELHEREAEERAKLTFSARLSRLWRNTGPGA